MLIDLHTHSAYSFDGHDSIEDICATAEKKGVSHIAITDHLDADGHFEGYYDKYEYEKAKKDILNAKEKFSGKINLFYGIELGQGYTHPDGVKKILEECGFEFIIGSIHNLVNLPDFYFINYENMPQKLIASLWERYLEEINNKLIPMHKEIPFSTLAHLTYPLRYIKKSGVEFDIKPYYYDIILIYKKLIENGIALEINTSGLRQGMGMTMPDYELVRLYRQCGGEYITVGSDAHYVKDIGADITQACCAISDIGFKRILFLTSDKKEVSIDIQ